MIKSILSAYSETGISAFYSAFGTLADYCGLKFLSPKCGQHPTLSNRERMWSVDTFGFSQTKWGWNYTSDPLTGNYFLHEAFPFCPYCEAPMQHDGNPFLEAFCLSCEANHRHPYYQVMQSRSFVLTEISKRYATRSLRQGSQDQNLPDLLPERRITHQPVYQRF
jgi:hypothetical protein